MAAMHKPHKIYEDTVFHVGFFLQETTLMFSAAFISVHC